MRIGESARFWRAPGREVATSRTPSRTFGRTGDATLATLETGGIGAASALAVGGIAYGLLSRERRELMREWVVPLHEALAQPTRTCGSPATWSPTSSPKNSPWRA
ncbi:hypothetical protein SAV31267_095930 [Streptomyces avermitilis]|uniref:Uncharacterized protein n=1 Tax=Streptomyces avermitilis TaxID=33903 RepID=A0A4D4N6A9_STRAX|nr:hypothetical protein SAV31267_095930 [Streptomyces avermitilis]